MALRNCSIVFDNRPNSVFYCGETVTGTVYLTLEENKICNALMLKVSGEAKCRWSEVQGTGKNRSTIYFYGNEIYFTSHNNLMAEQHIQLGTSDLLAGNHTFKFTFTLPLNLPSSCEGLYGYVRYTASVSLIRPSKIDLSFHMLFTVLSHVDLNLIPNAHLSVLNESLKNFYFFCFSKGRLLMTIQIPSSGFVSGQCIPITCNLRNDSKIKIETVKIELLKTILFTSTYPYTNRRMQISKVSSCSGGGADHGEEKSFELPLCVPPLPPSSFMVSSIVEVKYELIATAVVSGFRMNLKSITPIIIGTIPINTYQQSIVEQATSSYDNNEPPAFESMPPTYEEVLVEKIMEDDNNREFSPKYPVYNFDSK